MMLGPFTEAQAWKHVKEVRATSRDWGGKSFEQAVSDWLEFGHRLGGLVSQFDDWLNGSENLSAAFARRRGALGSRRTKR